ncbi:DUF2255 family protein [Streptomyces albidus (ex Kaewkla and Franco 2022)]|uniref:DUF2255 family protein n=1 Tax=Streptomyces albidus (ex Kaewkla and Franco 2022) TaxID=722709 RepID=UPI0015EE7431|nr:DUF2255 family protein [Streptomyces albidus (ex Kaewkla and Franco 2022)]
MPSWSSDQLSRIEGTDELQIQPQHADGTLRKPTTIWVIREGDEVFVRSYRGPDGLWLRTAQASHAGHIRCDGVDVDVDFTEIQDPGLNDRIDSAYRTKYAHLSDYVPSMTADPARATTLKLTPSESQK